MKKVIFTAVLVVAWVGVFIYLHRPQALVDYTAECTFDSVPKADDWVFAYWGGPGAPHHGHCWSNSDIGAGIDNIGFIPYGGPECKANLGGTFSCKFIVQDWK